MRRLPLRAVIEVTDFWSHGLLPNAVYLGLGLVAVAVGWRGQRRPYGIALTLTILLLVGIRNA